MNTKLLPKTIFLFLALFSVLSCNSEKRDDKADKQFYDNMKNNVMNEPDSNFMDSTNVFSNYDPANQSYDSLLIQIGNVYELDSNTIVKFDQRTPEELDGSTPVDTLVLGDETFTRDLHNITKGELMALRYNLDQARSVKTDTATDGGCRGKDCPVYTHVNKKEQKLYLYLNGEFLDTFATSTARSGYKTPDFSRKPDGRMFMRYSSHTYPGGNYEGLGNMPYAVFIEGGYAIHGATSGEIHELGHPASHGCIRIHPKNAKVYYNLVKYIGAENTWVDVTED